MKELRIIQEELKAPKGQFNNFGKYKYRSCEDILVAVKPLLAKTDCTLTITDDIIAVANRIYVKATATLTNKEGKTETTTGFAREAESKSGMDVSQITGAASSYARKYALNGLFCIDDTKDTDTEAYQQQAQKAATTQKPAQSYDAETLQLALQEIKAAKDAESLKEITQRYKMLYSCTEFLNAGRAKREELSKA